MVEPKSFLQAVVELLFHLVGTAVVFAFVVLLAWSLSWGVEFLHEIHRFPDDLLVAVHRFEYWLTLADMALTTVLIAAGFIKFFRELRG